MKFSIKIRKSIAFLVSLLLLSSCTVYQKSSLKELSLIDKKVLVKTNDGKRLKYYKVLEKDGEYWGQTKTTNGDIIETKIDSKNVVEAKKKDTALSAVATASIVAVPAVILFIIGMNDLSYGW